MTYWPWWFGGLALSGVMLAHWLATRRMMAVSGRYTALVNRLRLGPASEDEPPLDTAALVEAMRTETIAALGPDAVAADAPATEPLAETPAKPAPQVPQTVRDHLVFLGCLALGGLGSSLLSGRFHLAALVDGPGFARLTHGSTVVGALVLLLGGAFVGFGTRMAGGCTSGHGMCGVSRLQSGSLLATAAFFGTGVATAFALGWIR